MSPVQNQGRIIESQFFQGFTQGSVILIDHRIQTAKTMGTALR